MTKGMFALPLIFATIAMSCSPVPTHAADLKLDTIGLHVGSHHFGDDEMNNNNPGVYLAGTVSGVNEYVDGRWVTGTYYNSIRNQTFYVGRVFEVTPWFDVLAGVATGYQWAVVPALVPSVHYGPVRLSFMPPIADNAAVVHLSLEYRFK